MGLAATAARPVYSCFVTSRPRDQERAAGTPFTRWGARRRWGRRGGEAAGGGGAGAGGGAGLAAENGKRRSLARVMSSAPSRPEARNV